MRAALDDVGPTSSLSTGETPVNRAFRSLILLVLNEAATVPAQLTALRGLSVPRPQKGLFATATSTPSTFCYLPYRKSVWRSHEVHGTFQAAGCDSLQRQTSTATSAVPGGVPFWLRPGFSSHGHDCGKRLLITSQFLLGLTRAIVAGVRVISPSQFLSCLFASLDEAFFC